MKAIIAVLIAGSIFAQAQKLEFKPARPPYCTAQEFKVYWYNQLPVPRALDRDFRKLSDARSLFVMDVKAGNYDLPASQSAAEYNLHAANKLGDAAAAAKYESELRACEKAIAAVMRGSSGEGQLSEIEEQQRELSAAARAQADSASKAQSDARAEIERLRQEQQRMEREADQQETQREMQRFAEESKRIARETQERINKQASDR